MGRAGQQYVERGEYDISCHEGKQIIDAQEWERMVKVGIVLEMSIILRRMDSEDTRKNCPRCRRRNSSAVPDEGWIVWKVPGISVNF